MGSSKRTEDSVGWTSILENAHPQGKAPPGEGWKTMKQIHSEMGFGICKTRRLVQAMILDRKIETFTGSARAIDGAGLYRQVWYRPIDMK